MRIYAAIVGCIRVTRLCVIVSRSGTGIYNQYYVNFIMLTLSATGGYNNHAIYTSYRIVSAMVIYEYVGYADMQGMVLIISWPAKSP